MSFAFPLTGTITPVTQAETDGVFGNPGEGAAVTVACDLQPKGSEKMFQEFGVDVKFGAGFYVATDDADKLAIDAVVTVDGKRWRIAGEPSVRAYGSPLDHASVPLERLGLEVSGG